MDDDETVDYPGAWRSSAMPCPNCAADETEIAPWWDDHPDNGGEVIGELRRCRKCEWEVDL